MKAIILLNILPIALVASGVISINTAEQQKRGQMERSGNTVSASDSETTEVNNERENVYLYNDEVVLNHILKSESEDKEVGIVVGSVSPLAFDNVGNYKQKLEKEIEGRTEIASKEEKVKDKYFFTGGYCRLLSPLKVETLAQYASFSCDLEGSDDKVRLTALIQPEHISKALIARPLYVKTAEGNRFLVANGVMMNATQNNINLASKVNDYKIERLLAKGAIESTNIVSNYAREYLEAKKQSDVVQTAYGDDRNSSSSALDQLLLGSRSGVATNTKAPSKKDYVNMAGIELVSKAVELLGTAFLDNLDYLYEMDADTVYYVDLMVSTSESMEGVSYNLSSLVNKSPRGFGQTDSSSSGEVTTKQSGKRSYFKSGKTNSKKTIKKKLK